MIKFVYSEQVNKNMIEGYWANTKEFCEEHNLVYFEPTPENKNKVEVLIKTIKFPDIGGNIPCYIRYFGTWGMYHPEDNCISICPLDIEKAPGGLVGVVKHELLHLMHPEADTMAHEDKEVYINDLELEDK